MSASDRHVRAARDAEDLADWIDRSVRNHAGMLGAPGPEFSRHPTVGDPGTRAVDYRGRRYVMTLVEER